VILNCKCKVACLLRYSYQIKTKSHSSGVSDTFVR
jgi:hypothetical protein